jgi:hypothetical protein
VAPSNKEPLSGIQMSESFLKQIPAHGAFINLIIHDCTCSYSTWVVLFWVFLVAPHLNLFGFVCLDEMQRSI